MYNLYIVKTSCVANEKSGDNLLTKVTWADPSHSLCQDTLVLTDDMCNISIMAQQV